MGKSAKIYRGLAGSALTRNLHAKGHEENIVKPAHAELDFTNQADTEAFLLTSPPELPLFPQKRESRNPATGWAPAFAGTKVFGAILTTPTLHHESH